MISVEKSKHNVTIQWYIDLRSQMKQLYVRRFFREHIQDFQVFYQNVHSVAHFHFKLFLVWNAAILNTIK